jgi:hypothetical protein
MPPIVSVALVAGIVLFVFLLLATLAWSIRIRRHEGNFIPAPEEWKHRGGRNSASSMESRPDWRRDLGSESASKAEEEATSEWMREKKRLEAADLSEKVPIGAEPESPLRDFLRNAFPSISTVAELGKLVQQVQEVEGKSDTPEERKATIAKALAELAEQQPENNFLRGILDSLQLNGFSAADSESLEGVRIVQSTGRNLIHVDGVEFYSVEDIPDPEKREQARRMLASLHGKKQG